MLTFDEETHTYRWNGIKVPGVTSVLADYIRTTAGGNQYHVCRHTGTAIPTDIMEDAADKGKDIHLACQLTIQGGLDWDALDLCYMGPVKQFEAWMKQYQPQILFTEMPVYSVRYGYAGTIDIIAAIDRKVAVVDIKTGASSSVGPQTAAYGQAYAEQEKYRGTVERWVLWLPKNGDPFKFEKITNRQDFDYFKACLYCHQYQQGGKRK